MRRSDTIDMKNWIEYEWVCVMCMYIPYIPSFLIQYNIDERHYFSMENL